MTGDAFAEVHHLVAYAAEVHNGAGHDEERDSQHGERLCRVHDLLQQQPALGAGVKNEEVEECGAEQCVHYGQPREVEQEHQKDRDYLCKSQCHQKFPPST